METGRKAFTLVELLVVVSIIAVLLALLVPAIAKAVYEAEFAACAAQQRGVAQGAMLYAMDHKRAYPHRAATNDTTTGNYYPMVLTLPFGQQQQGNPTGYDDRPMLRPYMNMKSLLDPMTAKVDLDNARATSITYSSYSLWFGWKYTSAAVPSKGLLKMGQRWSWNGRRYSVMLGDTQGRWWLPFYFAHPDRAGGAASVVRQDQPSDPANPASEVWTLSLWNTPLNPPDNGRVYDCNFTFEDGSVRGYRDCWQDTAWFVEILRWEDRFDIVPLWQRTEDETGATNFPAGWLTIPREK